MAPASASHVVLLEDEPGLRASLQALLEEELNPAVVHPAANGPEALLLLREHDVQLIVCDHRRQEVDGLDFLRQARDEGCAAPAIMVTAHPEADRARADRHGLVHHTTLDLEALVHSAKRILHRSPSSDVRRASGAAPS